MRELARTRRLPVAVAIGLVMFAFWRALFAGGSLVSDDMVAVSAPFDAYRPDSFTVENGPGDPINIHAHWASLATEIRDGDAAWWNPDLAGGQPSMRAGLPIFNTLYLLVPAWFAPGLVAAIRALTAIGLSVGFLRAVGVSRRAALVGGLAFGFSGFMVGWMNWPHSSVAALAPGLLWAIERVIRNPRPWRSVPLGIVLAMMVWSSFPQETLYTLLGAAIYTAIRIVGELGDSGDPAGDDPGPRRRRFGAWALAGGGGAVLAVGLAFPHLVGFSEYLDWADTSHRLADAADSSAGPEYLLTAISPAMWGSDAVGVPWFGDGNWTEFNVHVGASVLVLALLGMAAGLHGSSRRRSIAVALGAMGAIGVLVGYIGGPVGVLVGDIVGDSGGPMTRAKVLISLAAALLAAFAVDEFDRVWEAGDRQRIRRVVLTAGLILGVTALAMAPSVLHWARATRAAGAVEETLAVATVSLIAAAGVLATLYARWRRWITGTGAGWALVAVVAFEMLSFAMPVPTIVSRAERLHDTPAHVAVREALDPGERLAGEAKVFFPNTTERFGIPDARGQLLKSAGYQALLKAVDPDVLRRIAGGTPTYPNIGIDTDPANPVWDAMGVGVWAQRPTSTPPGTVVKPSFGAGRADPAVESVTGRTVVPEGGLRAVLLDIQIPHQALVRVVVEVEGVRFESVVLRDPSDWFFMSVAVLGEDLAEGAVVEATITTDADPGSVEVATDPGGALVLGTIAGGDEFRLIRTDDVLLLDRLEAEFVRIFDAARMETEVGRAAALVEARGHGPSAAVTSVDVGLPLEPDPSARLDMSALEVLPDRVSFVADVDRDALVVLAQTAYPGWSATVDGKPVEIVLVDASFTGVLVAEGRHEVVLRFRPSHLRLISVVFAAALALALLGLADGYRRHLRPASEPDR